MKLITADVLTGLAMLPDESVQCVVTSPPYWGLRDYGVSGQIGLEPTIEEFVGKMVEVFREVRRVLRKDGVLFLNLGDSYCGSGGAGGDYNEGGLKAGQPKFPGRGSKGIRGGSPKHAGGTLEDQPNRYPQANLKAKDMCGIPWRVALALQADGWYLRSDIIWAKGNPMPQSVTDRPSTSHEYIFLLTKSAKYYFDAEAIREPVSGTANLRGKKDGTAPSMTFKMQEPGRGNRNNSSFQSYMKDLPPENGRNCRSVWHINSAPFPGSHFATFPTKLVRRCVAAGTSEKGCCPSCGASWKRMVEKSGGRDWRQDKMVQKGIPDELSGEGAYKRGQSATPLNDTQQSTTTGWTPTCTCNAKEPIPCTVLDPFSGAGTTALVAAKLGRDAIGIELNPEYVEMSRKRIAGELGMLCEIEVLKGDHHQ